MGADGRGLLRLWDILQPQILRTHKPFALRILADDIASFARKRRQPIYQVIFPSVYPGYFLHIEPPFIGCGFCLMNRTAVALRNSIPNISSKSNPIISTGCLASVSDEGEVKIKGMCTKVVSINGDIG